MTSPLSSSQAFRLSTILFLALCIFFLTLFTGLGVWQLQRLQWKNALIARIEARLDLPTLAAPPVAEWEQVTTDSHEYLPVTARGHFLHDKSILVSSVTDYGSGYWLMQPLQQEDGSHIFINRGFVPMDWRDDANHPDDPIEEAEIEITGLLRMSEGAGFWPRRNDPERDRWYSRQLEAFAQARELDNVAPYFIDADASLNKKGTPIGGLTVVSFRNTHLTYAITWFLMAAGVAAACIFLITHNRRK